MTKYSYHHRCFIAPKKNHIPNSNDVNHQTEFLCKTLQYFKNNIQTYYSNKHIRLFLLTKQNKKQHKLWIFC